MALCSLLVFAVSTAAFSSQEEPKPPPPPPFGIVDGAKFYSPFEFTLANDVLKRANDAIWMCNYEIYEAQIKRARKNAEKMNMKVKNSLDLAGQLKDGKDEKGAKEQDDLAEKQERDAQSWSDLAEFLEKTKLRRIVSRECVKMLFPWIQPRQAAKGKEEQKPGENDDRSKGSSGARLRLGTGFPLPISASYSEIRTATDGLQWCTYGNGTGSPKLLIPTDDKGNPIAPGGPILVADTPTQADGVPAQGGKQAAGPKGGAEQKQGGAVVAPGNAQNKSDDGASSGEPKTAKADEPLKVDDGTLKPGATYIEPGTSQAKPGDEAKGGETRTASQGGDASKQQQPLGPEAAHPPTIEHGGAQGKSGDKEKTDKTKTASNNKEPPSGDSVLKYLDPPPKGSQSFPIAKAEPVPPAGNASSASETPVSQTAPNPSSTPRRTTDTPSPATDTANSTIHVMLIDKATAEAKERGQLATTEAGQQVEIHVGLLLPPSKPDLPGLHRTDTAQNDSQDDGFDKDAAKCVIPCTLEIAKKDLPHFGISSPLNGTYRIVVDDMHSDGAVIELTDRGGIPDLSKGLPDGVSVTGSPVAIGSRRFMRIGSQSPADLKFALEQQLSRQLGRKVVIDKCIDVQPGPPEGMQPRSFGVLSALPEGRVVLDRGIGVTGGRR